MQLVIDRQGTVRCLYSEAIDLAVLGSLVISRASCVEPDDRGFWLVDLAPLADLGRGVESVRQVRRGGNIPRRSWLLFFDTDLQAEWIGIWDDAPPPPMAEIEGERPGDAALQIIGCRC